MLGSALAGTAKRSAAAVPAALNNFPWQRLVAELQVTTGSYAGAWRSMPEGPINWYFANLGLSFFVNDLPDQVRFYLDLYLKSTTPQGWISDVASDLSTPQAPDSHDAYCGTFLSLAVRYMRATEDASWWQASVARLKTLAWQNLLTQIKPNGLVRAFQGPAPNGIGYLMDQCEVYAGLRDFAEYLLEQDDKDAAYFAQFPANLGTAIHALFDPKACLWNWCDLPSPASDAWYPNLTAQIYPHLCDVHSGDAPGDYYRLNQGYSVLSQSVPDWQARPQDLYPWLVVGYYSALRQNQTSEAGRMLSMVLQYYLPGSVNTGRMLISEIGYARGIMGLSSRSPLNCSAI
jgi:hypothetical protein